MNLLQVLWVKHRYFPAEVTTVGEVRLGAYTFTSKRAVQTGKVKLAIRPEAWHMSLPGQDTVAADQASLMARVVRSVYLGSLYEYTVSSELGELFLVNHDVTAPFAVGQEVQLRLAEHGVSVIFE
jgi:iron(III) transport system ATP-binding protein